MGVIVVTGSASGIGAATRARLEEEGDAVIGLPQQNDASGLNRNCTAAAI